MVAANDMRPVDTETLLGVLESYVDLTTRVWPGLLTISADQREHWRHLGSDALIETLNRYLHVAAASPGEIRVFWKLGERLRFAGCNLPFARDAGFALTSDLLGATDFEKPIPWTRQASSYRADDEEVMRSGRSKLRIVERQEREGGLFWLHTRKVPLRIGEQTVGVLGAYETVHRHRTLALRR